MAAFDIQQNDVLIPNPNNPFYSVQTDSARVRGFEFEVRGNITREFEVVGGYSRLDPKVTSSIAGNAGKYLPNVNLDQASLWGKYTWYDGKLAGFDVTKRAADSGFSVFSFASARSFDRHRQLKCQKSLAGVPNIPVFGKPRPET